MNDILTINESPESESFVKQRAQMKHRRRRIIYNNDGGDSFGAGDTSPDGRELLNDPDSFSAGCNTPDGFLAVRMKAVLDTQVESVFYCTGATTIFTHQAKVGEVYGEHFTEDSGDFPRLCELPPDIIGNMRALAEIGTDVLALVVKFCHENDLEVFWTHRINDIHDTMLDWELSTWKRDHPEYLMGTPADWEKYPTSDPRNRWSALDFEIPEVLDYLIAIIDDVLERYDVDGIEIDYFRHAMFFRPNRTFQPATPEQVEILTGFQRRVRESAYAHGNRRGRPILVAARVPMTKGTCRHVGIDIERWLKENLLDVLTTGLGVVPFTMPTKEMVELGHAYDVPVYPACSASGMKIPHHTDEHWRGAAANAWHAGADGVYLFNTFPTTPHHPHFTELGDAEALARMNKVFVIDNKYALSGEFVMAVTQSQTLPVELDSSGQVRQVNLPVGDDVAAAGRLKDLTLRVQFAETTPQDMVELRLNDRVVKPTIRGPEWFTYFPKPDQFRQGDNALSFRVLERGDAKAKPIVVTSVELRVNYK